MSTHAVISAAEQAPVNALIYSNPAAIHAIPFAPNPIADTISKYAQIIYVNTGYGPAIYSYAHNKPHQVEALTIEYTNQANGHAIYSYPTWH
ncbi:hypothetical protein [Methylocucumis oryzae]|uniref:hypothetical protein n=1 Tax=Methylocucumis oryzae TaxID=1632867 RepID=UPI001EF9F920|nr:hypothetical protein [Methylocucumis oryzae]